MPSATQSQRAGGIEATEIGRVDAGDIAAFQIAAQFRRQTTQRRGRPVAGQAQTGLAISIDDFVCGRVHRAPEDRSDIAIFP